ncbi:oxidoreductase HTATIP2 isoform X2 [Folsomia candida]|uniref:Oxidoreductase HTATIP2 n=2 Tax=Folsomia candida TaxID=158441 RepID=A0A226D879_FOLCA|nr:oxidoreductase HTATIP2 isoform X2 [Folsomia candida]XP_035716091.1 oxidoreductase HTATIP2 isoform X2 [Folsomia candida]XP_035716092.1 oxidoreductase HTATIP2 isoform X2 [Folsomia candida]OXA40841.1 Oxidoreductase HTATIP2 [Folsomia candida]
MDANSDNNLSAFVFGYTGGVGRCIVNALAVEPRFKKVTLFGRRTVDLEEKDKKSTAASADFTKFTQDVVDFDKLTEDSEYFAEKLKGFDVGIYALGVNPLKTDEETFQRTTRGWLLAIAKLARDGGCRHFHRMSGALVNENSWWKFGRFGGETDALLGKISYPRISIYKPATILTEFNSGGMVGPRGVSVMRLLDRFRWWSVEGETVGQFLVQNCFTKPKDANNSVEVFTNAEINRWGKLQKK